MTSDFYEILIHLPHTHWKWSSTNLKLAFTKFFRYLLQSKLYMYLPYSLKHWVQGVHFILILWQLQNHWSWGCCWYKLERQDSNIVVKHMVHLLSNDTFFVINFSPRRDSLRSPDYPVTHHVEQDQFKLWDVSVSDYKVLGLKTSPTITPPSYFKVGPHVSLTDPKISL